MQAEALGLPEAARVSSRAVAVQTSTQPRCRAFASDPSRRRVKTKYNKVAQLSTSTQQQHSGPFLFKQPWPSLSLYFSSLALEETKP